MTTRAGCWTHQHLTYMKNLITRISNRFDQSAEVKQKISELTRTEKEILKLLSLGLSAKEIAEMQNVSTLTVHTHLNHIYRKIGVNSAVQAVRSFMLYKYGIIDLELCLK